MIYKKVKFYIPVTKISGGDEAPEKPLMYDTDDIHKQYIPKSYWPVYDEIKSKLKIETELEPTLTIDDIKFQLPYKSDNRSENTQFLDALINNIQVGQRKLFLTELAALNELFDNHEEQALIISSGSAPNFKMWLSMQLYPNARFLLFDSDEFYIYDGRYDLPHYVRLDEDYIKSGDKWGIYQTEEERAFNHQEFVYLSANDSNTYESKYYKQKNILWYNPETRKLEMRNKPFDDSGVGKSINRLSEGPKPTTMLTDYVTQASIDFVFENAVSKTQNKYMHVGGGDVANLHRVFIAEELLTEKIAQYIANSCAKYPIKIAYLNDLHNSEYKNMGITDTDILLNWARTYIHTRIIKPDISMIKFRMFYLMKPELLEPEELNRWKDEFDRAAELGFDFRVPTWKDGDLMFYKGEVRILPWSGPRSGETRIIVRKADVDANNIVKYKILENEQKCMFYNYIERFALFHKNPNYNPLIGFDNCNDCAIENSIWEGYKKKNPYFDISKGVSLMDNILHVPIFNRRDVFSHGGLFTKTTMNDFRKNVEKSDYILVQGFDYRLRWNNYI